MSELGSIAETHGLHIQVGVLLLFVLLSRPEVSLRTLTMTPIPSAEYSLTILLRSLTSEVLQGQKDTERCCADSDPRCSLMSL